MGNDDSNFDLVLSYPQWQGSGRSENLIRGADAAAQVCGQYGTLASVPSAGIGEASNGINRWTAILEQFRAAQAILNDRQPRRVLTAGGDCACDIAVIDYLHNRYPDLTVIWVDAHLDANSPSTLPAATFMECRWPRSWGRHRSICKRFSGRRCRPFNLSTSRRMLAMRVIGHFNGLTGCHGWNLSRLLLAPFIFILIWTHLILLSFRMSLIQTASCRWRQGSP